MENAKRRISFCPHCGNVAPQRLVHKHETHAKGIDAAGNVTVEEPESYFLVLCETCDGPLLYFLNEFTPGEELPYIPDTEEFDETEPDPFYFAELVWPHQGVPAGLPDEVMTSYQDALRIKRVSPPLFAVQIRRALEAMCNDRGAVKGRLEKTQGLVGKGRNSLQVSRDVGRAACVGKCRCP